MMKNSNILMINGQEAVVTYESDIKAFRGKFLKVNGYLDFVSDSTFGLVAEGEAALADWMKDCREEGIAPFREDDKPRAFTLRYPDSLEPRITAAAGARAMSKNQYIITLIEHDLAAS